MNDVERRLERLLPVLVTAVVTGCIAGTYFYGAGREAAWRVAEPAAWKVYAEGTCEGVHQMETEVADAILGQAASPPWLEASQGINEMTNFRVADPWRLANAPSRALVFAFLRSHRGPDRSVGEGWAEARKPAGIDPYYDAETVTRLMRDNPADLEGAVCDAGISPDDFRTQAER